MRFGVDASTPDVTDLPVFDEGTIVAGYIGGRALRVWLPHEWDAVRQAGLRPLAIYVAPNSVSGHESGANYGNDALRCMGAAGLTSTVVLDVELNPVPDVDWLDGFIDACAAGDLGVVLYCNQFTRPYVWRDGFEGLWLASYGPRAPIFGERLLGWQYLEGPLWDWSVWDDEAPTSGWA